MKNLKKREIRDRSKQSQNPKLGAAQKNSKVSSDLCPLPFKQILSVVAETDHYVIVDKPALLDSQNSRADRTSVVTELTKKYGFAGLVHRLDFGTSGLMVCAKNAEQAKKLTQDLQAGKIKRTYLAMVLGKISPEQNTNLKIEFPVDGKPAVSHYKIIEIFPNATLVEVELETGRKHQIRRHFSELGHPLLGDHLYGKRGSQRLFHRPALHAVKLIVGNNSYSANPPQDFLDLVNRLRK